MSGGHSSSAPAAARFTVVPLEKEKSVQLKESDSKGLERNGALQSQEKSPYENRYEERERLRLYTSLHDFQRERKSVLKKGSRPGVGVLDRCEHLAFLLGMRRTATRL